MSGAAARTGNLSKKKEDKNKKWKIGDRVNEGQKTNYKTCSSLCRSSKSGKLERLYKY